MYTSEFKINKSIAIFKVDLFELEKLIRDNFTASKRKEDFEIRATCKDRVFSKLSMEELFSENLPLTNDRLMIKVIGWSEDKQINKSVEIRLSGILRDIEIEGDSEVWVEGMKIILKKFFNERKFFYSRFESSFSTLVAVILGLSFVIAVSTIKAGNYLLTGILILIIILSLFFSSQKINKMFPYVKINYFPKESNKFNLKTKISLIMLGVSILTLIATIVL